MEGRVVEHNERVQSGSLVVRVSLERFNGSFVLVEEAFTFARCVLETRTAISWRIMRAHTRWKRSHTMEKWSNVSRESMAQYQYRYHSRFLFLFFFIQDKYMFWTIGKHTSVSYMQFSLPSENNYVIVILCIIQRAIRFFSWKNDTRVVQAYYKNLNTYCCYSSSDYSFVYYTNFVETLCYVISLLQYLLTFPSWRIFRN